MNIAEEYCCGEQDFFLEGESDVQVSFTSFQCYICCEELAWQHLRISMIKCEEYRHPYLNELERLDIRLCTICATDEDHYVIVISDNGRYNCPCYVAEKIRELHNEIAVKHLEKQLTKVNI